MNSYGTETATPSPPRPVADGKALDTKDRARAARAGRSPDQRAAFARLRERAEPSRFRVKADAEGWPVIPGRRGQIEHHDKRVVAVYTARPRLFARLLAVPGVRPHQTGDREIRALFPVEALAAVAAVIRARRRRVLSHAEVEARRERLARAQAAASSRAQEATSSAMPGSGKKQGEMQATNGT